VFKALKLAHPIAIEACSTKLDREVYWPARKDWGAMNLPKTWGSMVLVE